MMFVRKLHQEQQDVLYTSEALVRSTHYTTWLRAI